ncbi:MAG: hypothetical protein LBN34_06545 [Clostridiales Family XIII bacterium]|jgi:DNA-directed RNA polymerase alpha subunit|nr:hypothetical protein [Clostridiales Family XIII bacterium]
MTTIDDLGLTARSYNLLKRKGITDVDVLLDMTDEEIFGLYDGAKAVEEITAKLRPLRKAKQVQKEK